MKFGARTTRANYADYHQKKKTKTFNDLVRSHARTALVSQLRDCRFPSLSDTYFPGDYATYAQHA